MTGGSDGEILRTGMVVVHNTPWLQACSKPNKIALCTHFIFVTIQKGYVTL